MVARFDDDVPQPYTSTRPAPARQPTAGRGTSLRRGKTLTRPERHVAPVPLINPHADGGASYAAAAGESVPGAAGGWDWWVVVSHATTFWAPPALLRMAGIRERQSRQAWREKITLCWIAILCGAVVGFATMGLQRALCPAGSSDEMYNRFGSVNQTLSISGWAFNISSAVTTENVNFYTLADQMSGQDITNLFTRTAADYPACSAAAKYASTAYCSNSTSSSSSAVTNASTLSACPLSQLSTSTLSSLSLTNMSMQEGYSWDQVAALRDYLVIDGAVLNLTPYIAANPSAIANDDVDAAIRQSLFNQSGSGKDVTRVFYNTKTLRDAIPCLQARYAAGYIDKTTPGCFVASLFLYASLVVILAVVLIRFAMACIFNWFLSRRLVVAPTNMARPGVSPTVMPEGANMSVHNRDGTAPWAGGGKHGGGRKASGPPGGGGGGGGGGVNGLGPGADAAGPMMSMSRIGAELFTVCLVTAYSEGEDSLRSTLESVAATNYSDSRKLLWVVCDGMITGAGEKRSTPDMCVAMLDADPRFGNPQPMGYIAVGSGAKRENRAMVYAGHYVSQNGHRTPTVVIVKCGMPGEARDKKPGNRGKRDSQLVLMNFFSRVTYNDRMTPLDYDLFRKVHTLMGVTPDFFEVCLMVDADTKVYPDSLRHLVNSMHADNMIMGVCGETRIANKRQSWVTAIQVYEYYISHHLVKAFESVFGGVTCLPGCFSMYRIKARKDADNDWVPILVKPEIIREYSQSDVVTLHQKNLLLLGEDRFLSTIMLRTFPNRKNIFLPQARCRTVAPDTFAVLLSQRRRWINSTVHNLMELVRVRNLCGTFCFSMQFVVFMDLIGTVVLPVAICLTLALVINSIIQPPSTFEEAIPLMLLAAVLGLPAILILITTFKVVYVAWMLAYLLALPIWNFVLPVYSFWHFDDFSWGETRRVEGEVVSKMGHDDKTAVFDGTTIPLRRWDDWERSRLRKQRRDEKRRRQMEKSHGAAFYGDGGGGGGGGVDGLAAPGRHWAQSEYDSDAGSIFSSEEDVWGADIGGYNENNPAFPPPPTALPPETVPLAGQTLGMDEMAALLDQGWDEPPPAAFRPDRMRPPPAPRAMPPMPMPPMAGAPAPAQAGGAGGSVSSAVDSRPLGHAKKRSGGGPRRGAGYDPLQDDEWGGRGGAGRRV